MPTTHPTEIAVARDQWHPQGAYLNTASYGLPPDCAWEALQEALADWRAGRTSWEHWGEATNAAREAFATLVHVAPETVATAATVSELLGLVASSLPDGTAVLAPDIDFASAPLPLHGPGPSRRDGAARAARRGRRGDRRGHGRRGRERGADGHRRGRRPRRDRRRGRRARRDDGDRRDPGRGLAAVRRRALRRRRLPRLQVAHVAARHGVHDRAPGASSTASCRRPRVVGGRGRRTPRTSARRCAWRRPRAASTPRRRGFRGSARMPASRSSTRSGSRPSTPTTSAWRTASAPASGSSRRTRRSCRPTSRTPASALEAAGIVAAERGGRLRASWHLYNTEADVDAALDALAGG